VHFLEEAGRKSVNPTPSSTSKTLRCTGHAASGGQVRSALPGGGGAGVRYGGGRGGGGTWSRSRRCRPSRCFVYTIRLCYYNGLPSSCNSAGGSRAWLKDLLQAMFLRKGLSGKGFPSPFPLSGKDFPRTFPESPFWRWQAEGRQTPTQTESAATPGDDSEQALMFRSVCAPSRCSLEGLQSKSNWRWWRHASFLWR